MNKLKFGFSLKKGKNKGRISSFHRGGGDKKRYHQVDIYKNLINVPGKIVKINSDRFRTSQLMLVAYSNGVLSYSLKPVGLKKGDVIQNYLSPKSEDLNIGCATLIKFLSVGTLVHNIELVPGKGSKLVRSAGSYGKIIKKNNRNVVVKLPSGEFRLIRNECMVTIGQVGNRKHKHLILGKAGVKRRLGRRPIVRGIAMNPVDHPHGGRANGGKTPRTPWGKITRGVRTVKNNHKYLVKRRNR